MRQIISVTKGNMRKNKGVYIGIFFLLVLVSVSLFSIFSYNKKASSRDKEVLEKNGFGDMLAAPNNEVLLKANGTSAENIIRNMEKSSEVDHVNRSGVIYAGIVDCNGKKGNSTQFLLSENDPYLSYTQYDKHNKETARKLKKGEISVPVSFQELYGCSIGDRITLGSKKNNRSYKIASFLEDPFMGSTTMGIKTCLLNDADMEELAQAAQEEAEAAAQSTSAAIKKNFAFQKSYLLNIFQSKDSTLSPMKFEKELNSVSDMAAYCWISMSKTSAMEYMMLTMNIFASILVAFAIMFFIASLTVLSYNISTSIQLDYCNIGILKAVGMSNTSIRVSLLLGYLIASVAAVVVSIPLSVALMKVLTSVTRAATGLYVEASLDAPVVTLLAVALLAFIILFIMLKTIRLAKIAPLMAICDGGTPVHFSSTLKLPVSKKLLSLSLSYRQFVSGKKQYISVIAVTAIITLCMVMMNQTCLWANEPKMVSSVFDVADSDMSAAYETEEIREDAERIIKKYTGFEAYQRSSRYMLFEDMQIYVYILDDTEHTTNLMEGRTCKYANEILVGKQLAAGFDLQVGDEVTVKNSGNQGKYIISGIYSGGNDMGKSFILNFDGYQLLEPDADLTPVWGETFYQLEDDSCIDTIIKEMGEKYRKNEQFKMTSTADLTIGGADVIVEGINGITVLVYALGVVFIIVTVSIVCSKMIAKEKRDYGIYKSIGFTSSNIRLLLALRFAVASFVGAVLGILLDVLFGPEMFHGVFASFGIYNYKPGYSLSVLLIPVLFITVLFTIIAYVRAGKVRKCDVRVLITE